MAAFPRRETRGEIEQALKLAASRLPDRRLGDKVVRLVPRLTKPGLRTVLQLLNMAQPTPQERSVQVIETGPNPEAEPIQGELYGAERPEPTPRQTFFALVASDLETLRGELVAREAEYRDEGATFRTAWPDRAYAVRVARAMFGHRFGERIRTQHDADRYYRRLSEALWSFWSQRGRFWGPEAVAAFASEQRRRAAR